jgi:hypothetical protein
MPGHDNLNWISGAPLANAVSLSNPLAYREMECGHCNRQVVAAVLVTTNEAAASEGGGETAWLRCPNCGQGSVLTPRFGLLPGSRSAANLGGLPAAVSRAYDEARSTASVNAWTATEMMCRKILMHIAVDKGAKGGDTFAAYLTFLQGAGYVSPVMNHWVDLIRKHGNEAVHELPEVTEERGRSTLIFTEQLLRMTYEMDALAHRFAPPAAGEAQTGTP